MAKAKFDRSKYFASLGLLILSIGEAAASLPNSEWIHGICHEVSG